jgi:hypothetical protein
MSDSSGIAAPAPVATAIPPSAAGAGAELPAALLALQEAATFAATVIGRSPEGATLLRSAFGTLSLKTATPLATGTQVQLRFQPGNPPGVSLVGVLENEATEIVPPPTRVDLGTTTGATVVATNTGAAPASLPLGARLLLRIVPPLESGPSTLSGQIVLGAGTETIVETPVGTLALDLRVALAPGTEIAFERLADLANAPPASPSPAPTNGWPALDQALAALDRSAPALAQQMRAVLAPGTPESLAGTLMFLIGALYRGKWPGEPVERALARAGESRLTLAPDIAELQRLSRDEATDPWRVLVLPLLSDATVTPLKLYLRRRGSEQRDDGDGGMRFVFEAELKRLGALQLDGRLSGSRFDLVLRSRTSLSPELREATAALFRRASAAQGLHGDMVFATAAAFAVSPLAAMRPHVEMQA